MGIIGWILLGFLAGVIAKAIMPGGERVGFILTTLLGIGGRVARRLPGLRVRAR